VNGKDQPYWIAKSDQVEGSSRLKKQKDEFQRLLFSSDSLKSLQNFEAGDSLNTPSDKKEPIWCLEFGQDIQNGSSCVQFCTNSHSKSVQEWKPQLSWQNACY